MQTRACPFGLLADTLPDPVSAAASLFSLEIVTPKVVPAEKRVEVPPTLTQAHATVFASDNSPQQQQTVQQQVVTSLVSLETVNPKFVPVAKRVEVPPNITQARTFLFASDSLPQQNPTCENKLIFILGSKADNPFISLETVTPQVVPAAKRVEVPPIMPTTQAHATPSCQ